jgi:hypothetical protein
MKKTYITIIFALLLTVAGAAQIKHDAKSNDEYKTIIGGRDVGGYGALGLGYGRIDNRHALILNVRGGIVLGRTLGLGFSGTGFMNEYQQRSPGSNFESSLVGGYGGVYVELILGSRYPVSVSFPTTAGIGGLAFSSWDRSRDNSDDLSQVGYIEEEGTFFVVEPSVELNFRFVRWLTISAFGKYRFTTPLTESFTQLGVSTYALESYSAGVIFKFGKM